MKEKKRLVRGILCILYIHVLALHKATYIVLKLGAQQTGMWRGDGSKSTWKLLCASRREVKNGKGGCCCIINNCMELLYCAASVDFSLLRIYS